MFPIFTIEYVEVIKTGTNARVYTHIGRIEFLGQETKQRNKEKLCEKVL